MKIIATIGDPNGIGLECLTKSLIEIYKNDNYISNDYFNNIEIEIAGNSEIISEYLKNSPLAAKVQNDKLILANQEIKIINCCGKYSPIFGEISREAGKAAAESIIFAVDETLKQNYDAMVTMPISKESIRLSGWQYPGHTEMIAAKCKVKHPLMILFHENMRVGLVTIHTAIENLQYEITGAGITQIACSMNKSLKQDFAIPHPRIALLGLNPHAGENGEIGKQENDMILPAIENLRKKGISAEGPFAADGFFGFGEYKKYDGILAMYHDQGLIPLKLLAQGDGVNFTAGLPIVRTSPDHGTAFSLAGKWQADPKSTISSILAAAQITSNRREGC